MRAISIALWVIAPVVLSGLTHVAVIKLGLFRKLASVPLDLGATSGGKRLFGENKTLRGAVVMIAATALWVLLQTRLSAFLGWRDELSPPFECLHPIAWGALVGAGYVAGELPNSFVKRRLGIAAGAAARGSLRVVFWTIDQVDSLVGVMVFLAAVWHPSMATVAALFGVTLLVHPIVALVMYFLGLKSRVG